MRHFIRAGINFFEGQLTAVVDEMDRNFVGPLAYSIRKTPGKSAWFLEYVHVEQDGQKGNACPAVADKLVSPFEVDEEEVEDQDDEGSFEDNGKGDIEGTQWQLDVFGRSGGSCM